MSAAANTARRTRAGENMARLLKCSALTGFTVRELRAIAAQRLMDEFTREGQFTIPVRQGRDAASHPSRSIR